MKNDDGRLHLLTFLPALFWLDSIACVASSSRRPMATAHGLTRCTRCTAQCRRCTPSCMSTRSDWFLAELLLRFLVYYLKRMASQSQVFTLLGDSNVQRHMNPMSCRDRPMMSTCQVLPCGRISAFAETLRAVRPESNVVIVACLTNFLTSSVEAGSSVVFRIEPVLRDSIAIINEFAVAHQDIHVVVSPPMYRQCPIWYRDCLPEVMTKFSDIFWREGLQRVPHEQLCHPRA